MTTLDYIRENYKEGEPILLRDLRLDISYNNLCQQTKRLFDEGVLCRYMDGVYYLPKTTTSGVPYRLDPNRVAELKFICNKDEFYGCYSGHTLANILGLSEQVPMVREIVSNNASAIRRVVRVGTADYVVRRAGVVIKKDNVKVVMLLEILKDVDELCDSIGLASERLKDFVVKNGICRRQMDCLLPSYPMRTYKAIYDLGLSNVFA